MTLDKLHEVELALMRQAFEIACTHAGLSLSADQVTPTHANLARIIQSLVEQGHTDAAVIAELSQRALDAGDDAN